MKVGFGTWAVAGYAALLAATVAVTYVTAQTPPPPPPGPEALPAMRFDKGDLVTPSDYFATIPATLPASDVWGQRVVDPDNNPGTQNNVTVAERPAEIRALARSLQYDPGRMFDYVQHQVRYEPRWGASKGAMGALIDGSGSAFDQAQLLVELLREARGAGQCQIIDTIQYHVGTITLNNAEDVRDVLGTTDAAEVREILSAGGVPAVVNGTSTVSSVQMGHAWVTAEIRRLPGGAANCSLTDAQTPRVVMDPTLKVMTRTSGLLQPGGSLQIGMTGYDDTSIVQGMVRDGVSVTSSGAEQGTASSTAGGVKGWLTGMAGKMVERMQDPSSSYYGKTSEEILGDERISRASSAAWLNSGFGDINETQVDPTTGDWTAISGCTDTGPNTAANPSDCLARRATHATTLTFVDKLPDVFRTSMRLCTTIWGGKDGTSWRQTCPTAQAPRVYGVGADTDLTRIDTKFFVDSIYGRALLLRPDHAQTYWTVKDSSGRTGCGSSFLGSCGDPWKLKLELDGQVIDQLVGPVEVPDRVARLEFIVDNPFASRSTTCAQAPCAIGSLGDGSTVVYSQVAGTAAVVHAWGDQNAALALKLLTEKKSQLEEPTGIRPCSHCNRESQREYQKASIGARWAAQFTRATEIHDRLNGFDTRLHYAVGVIASRYDLCRTDGLTPRAPCDQGSGDVGGATVYRPAWEVLTPNIQASMGVAVKRTASRTTPELVERARKASHWTLAGVASTLEGSIVEQVGDTYDYDSLERRFVLSAERQAGETTPTSNFYRAVQADAYAPASQAAADYLTAGYAVTGTTERHEGSRPDGVGGVSHNGLAFVAFKPDASEIAYMITPNPDLYDSRERFKGAGGAQLLDERKALMGATNVLEDDFKDRSVYRGVNILTGELSFKSGQSFSVGEGEFPYKLTLTPEYRSGGTHCFNCPSGWSHNFDMEVSVTGDGLEAMGQTRPQPLATTIVAIRAAYDIFYAIADTEADQLKAQIGTAFAFEFWRQHLTFNVVTFRQGQSQQTFVRALMTRYGEAPGVTDGCEAAGTCGSGGGGGGPGGGGDNPPNENLVAGGGEEALTATATTESATTSSTNPLYYRSAYAGNVFVGGIGDPTILFYWGERGVYSGHQRFNLARSYTYGLDDPTNEQDRFGWVLEKKDGERILFRSRSWHAQGGLEVLEASDYKDNNDWVFTNSGFKPFRWDFPDGSMVGFYYQHCSGDYSCNGALHSVRLINSPYRAGSDLAVHTPSGEQWMIMGPNDSNESYIAGQRAIFFNARNGLHVWDSSDREAKAVFSTGNPGNCGDDCNYTAFAEATVTSWQTPGGYVENYTYEKTDAGGIPRTETYKDRAYDAPYGASYDVPVDSRPSPYWRLTKVEAPVKSGTPADQLALRPNAQFTYNALGQVKEIRDAFGTQRGPAIVYSAGREFSAMRHPPTARETAGAVVQQYYDDRGRLVAQYDEDGLGAQMSYDVRGRVTWRTYSDGRSVGFAYDNLNNVTEVRRRPAGGAADGSQDMVVKAEYGGKIDNYQIRKLTDALGRVTTFAYYGQFGDYAVARNYQGDARQTGYGKGMLQTVWKPDLNGNPTGVYWHFKYGGVANSTAPLGRLSEMTGPSTVTITYDADFTPKKQSVQATGTTSLDTFFEYTDFVNSVAAGEVSGLLKSATELGGVTTQYSYDQDGRELDATAPLGNVTRSYYDPFGRTSATLGRYTQGGTEYWRQSTQAYSLTSQATTAADAAGDAVTTLYDERDRPIETQSPSGRISYTQYTPAGKVLRVWEENPGGYDRATCPYVVDTAPGYLASGEAKRNLILVRENVFEPTTGRISQVRDACGQATTYTYDGFGRITKTTYPDGLYETWTYDAGGRVTEHHKRRAAEGDPHVIVRYAYDGHDNVKTRTIEAPGRPTETVETTYDVYDHATAITRTEGGVVQESTGYTYDLASRITSETQNSKTVSYGYRDNYGAGVERGGRTKITWADGFMAHYVYDGADRLIRIEAEGPGLAARTTLVSYTYNELGERLTAAYGNGVVSDYRFKVDGDLSLIKHAKVGAWNVSWDFTTDKEGRIDTETVSDGQFEYLPLLTSTDGYGDPTSINQLTTKNADGFEYDPVGNLKRVTRSGAQLRRYVFDGDNNLREAWGPSTQLGAYRFDGLGRRKWKSAAGAQTWFLHAGSQEIAEYDAVSGRLLRRYIPGPGTDEVAAWIEYPVSGAAVLRYVHANRQGSVVAITEADGSVQARYTYSPYGEVPAADAGGYPFRYTGQRYDPETGLHHYKARAYDPALGVFLQTDPAGYAQSLNLYGYALGDPLNGTDPTGAIVQFIPMMLQAAAAIASAAPEITTVSEVVVTLGTKVAAVSGPALLVSGVTLAVTIVVNPNFGSAKPDPCGDVVYCAKDGSTRSVNGRARSAPPPDVASTPPDGPNDPNKLNHIFGKNTSRHKLDGLVRKYGSEQRAFDALNNAARQQITNGPAGQVIERQIVVGGQNVTVRGLFVNGQFRLGTAFIP